MQKTLASAQSRLFETAAGGRLNYLEPKGDPGFYGPDSVAWRVHANPISLAIGGVAAVITTYGSTAMAQARVDMVTRMHQRVSGETPEGHAYTALEPELMTWVHVTAGYGFLNAYVRYVDPHLS